MIWGLFFVAGKLPEANIGNVITVGSRALTDDATLPNPIHVIT